MGCTNTNPTKKNISQPESIILGFELGMERKLFYDSLQKKLDAGIIFEITDDYDIKNNLKRFKYPLETVNNKVDIVFFSVEDLFYENRLMEFTCFMEKDGTKDTVENAFRDVLDLYMIKYKDYQYQYGYESDRLAQLGINYKPKYEQPKYLWSKSNTKIEITSDLSALLMDGDHYKSYPIKNYEDIKSDRYSVRMNIRYTDESLMNKKTNTEKQEKENIERKKYQKADSLSKLI
jgi:hypothetical protein